MSDIWTAAFGDQYTRRNAGTETDMARKAMWELLLPGGLESILEVGANVGKNLEAISLISDAELYASEPNELARAELENVTSPTHINGDFCDKLSWADNHVDLVITSGLLIHIPPNKLMQSMREIYRVSRRWIISAEYFAPSEEMVPYRGHTDALWRRDYGSLWLDSFTDLQCHAAMFAWKRMTGLDNLTFWVLEKGHSRRN